ncbi:MAG: Hint domain-containing protein [Paracoccaceae bacterium]
MPVPYFSEIKYLGGAGADFIEVAVDAGADVSGLAITVYFSNGSIRSTNTLAGITSTLIAGKDVYVIDTTSSGTFSGLAASNGLALSDGSGVYSFVSFTNTPAAVTATTGPAAGMTSTEIGSAGAGSSLISNDGGANYTVETMPTPGAIPCLTGGTLIETDTGQVPVEHLVSGSLVMTIEGDLQPIQLSMKRKVCASDMALNPKLCPVRICAGALGRGLPRRDLLVSRQHRMLISSPIVERMFGVSEVLVAAHKLVGIPGIIIDTELAEVEYFHLIFAEHEVIFAEGAPTESLFLGPEALRSLPGDLLDELLTLFPDLAETPWPLCARRIIPTAKRQTHLIARHVSNQRQLLASLGGVESDPAEVLKARSLN